MPSPIGQTTLSAPASLGATAIVVVNPTTFPPPPGKALQLDTGGSAELVIPVSYVGTTINLASGLAHNHSTGAMVVAIGNLAKPTRQYLQRSGQLFDWNGRKSANAIVTALSGQLNTTGAQYWNRNISALVAAPAYPGVNYYTVLVWDCIAQALVSLIYPESELQPLDVDPVTFQTPGSLAIAYGQLLNPPKPGDPLFNLITSWRLPNP